MKLAGGTQITVVTPSFLLVPPALATWNLRIPFSQVFPIINRVISSQSWTLIFGIYKAQQTSEHDKKKKQNAGRGKGDG